MARRRLTMALDFTAEKGATEHGRFSYRHNGNWYVVSWGPTYSNTYQITDLTADDVKALERMEKKEDDARGTRQEAPPADASGGSVP